MAELFALAISQRRNAEERAALEAQLFQAQKMEAIGTLAGGIAHDFNNILAAIMGYTELALSDSHDDSVDGNLEQVLKATHRAKNLVQQILSFSRRQEQERKAMHLSPLVKETMKLLRASLPSTIEIRQELSPGVGAVWVDPTQMHQLLMNLCANASHAMRNRGGILKVTLDNMLLAAPSAAGLPELEPGSYVRLAISDTGHGIPPDIQARIFEPFFTTKGKGEGTGMGLAVVHGIVKSHGGTVRVESRSGRGGHVHGVSARGHRRGWWRRYRTKTLLRQPAARNASCLWTTRTRSSIWARRCWERLGYRVTAIGSAPEALEEFAKDPGGYDLVITDQTMPRLTGVELTRELMRLRADIPVILCTGLQSAGHGGHCPGHRSETVSHEAPGAEGGGGSGPRRAGREGLNGQQPPRRAGRNGDRRRYSCLPGSGPGPGFRPRAVGAVRPFPRIPARAPPTR